MILRTNTRKPRRLGTDVYPRHTVFYENTAVIAGPAPALGNLTYLFDSIYSHYCVWNGSSITVTGSYTGTPEVLIIANTNADYIKGSIGGSILEHIRLRYGLTSIAVSTEGDAILIDTYSSGLPLARLLAPGETQLDVTDQKIVILPLYKPAANGTFSITLTGNNNITMNKFYIGSGHSFNPAGSFTYGLEVKSHGKLSDIGIVYGFKGEAYRTLECSFDLIDNNDRLEMERYMVSVQNVQAHFVQAHGETEYIPPLFAILENMKLPNKKEKNTWLWSGTTLTYREVK